jgi:hypothetical protein
MLQQKNLKEDMKRCRTTLLSDTEIRLAYQNRSCCSKNCMQYLIQGSLKSTSRSTSVRGNHAGNSSSSSSTSVLSPDDTTFDYDDTSLFCQPIGVPMESIPFLHFDKLIEEVRRPLFALIAGTSSTAEANEQLRYSLVQKFTENRI